MGIVGNGASINTLMEAGINTADILIAVTASDELNLYAVSSHRKRDTATPSPVSVILFTARRSGLSRKNLESQ